MKNTTREHKGASLMTIPNEYCIIDIETTGLSPQWDNILEVACIKIQNNQIIDQYSSLVKHDRPDIDGLYVNDFIEELTGITNDMILSAPNIKTVLKEFKSFIGKEILIGHNVNFDINFLYDNFTRLLSCPLENDFIDTMRLFRRHRKDLIHHRLREFAEIYNIDYSNAHRALDDCKITYDCFKSLCDEILAQYNTIEEFCAHTTAKPALSSNITCTVDTIDPTNPLFGKVCVFTGTLDIPRKEAMQIVVNMGGIIGDNITAKTNYLILGNNDYCPHVKDGKSNKQKKAEKFKLQGKDIEVIPESVFNDMICE